MLLYQEVTKRDVDKAQLAHACYDILGYGLLKTLGEGNPIKLIGDAQVPADAHLQLENMAGKLGDGTIAKWVIKLALDALLAHFGV